MREAVVVRQPDATWGEVPVLVVDTREERPSEAELLALCAGRLASYKRPKRILFADGWPLPCNNTGKIVRADVKRWVSEQG